MQLSIVIPAYNEEALLGKCLESVSAELTHTQYEVEVIVVNNASSDRTEEVARQFSFVRVIHEPRKGLVRARQAGYEASVGALIANIDADTMMPAGWIERVMKEFSSNPELVALSGPYSYYDLSPFLNRCILLFYLFGKWVSFFRTLIIRKGATLLQGGNFIVRRSVLDQAGGFDLNFDFYGEDTAIARRMSAYGKVKFSFRLPMYTSGRRLKEEGILKMALKYAINFFWATLFGRPYTNRYRDIRTQ